MRMSRSIYPYQIPIVIPSLKSGIHVLKDHEFYDPIAEWLEQSYLASLVAGNKLHSFLALAKKLGAEQHKLTRGL